MVVVLMFMLMPLLEPPERRDLVSLLVLLCVLFLPAPKEPIVAPLPLPLPSPPCSPGLLPLLLPGTASVVAASDWDDDEDGEEDDEDESEVVSGAFRLVSSALEPLRDCGKCCCSSPTESWR